MTVHALKARDKPTARARPIGEAGPEVGEAGAGVLAVPLSLAACPSRSVLCCGVLSPLDSMNLLLRPLLLPALGEYKAVEILGPDKF